MSGSMSTVLFNQQKGVNRLLQNDFGYLQATGPQLVNFHTYNMGVAFQKEAPSVGQCPAYPRNQFMGGNYWVNSGLDPEDPENYYKWNPSGSQMRSYQDTQTPFLVQRGDVIRVEGNQTIRRGGSTRSVDFQEDFTVMDIINYHYSSSAELASLNVGNFTTSPVERGGKVFSSAGNLLEDQGVTATVAGTTSPINVGTGGAQAVFSSDGSTIVSAYFVTSGSSGTSTGASNYAVGQTYNVNLSSIGGPSSQQIYIDVKSMKNKLKVTNVSTIVSDTGSDNNWAICTIDYCQVGSFGQCFSPGYFSVEWPGFLVTDRDPEAVLDGITNGEIKRFTIRRQVENDSTVEVTGISPPPLVPTVASQSFSGMLRLGSVIGSNFYGTNTANVTGGAGNVVVDILPNMTQYSGLGGKATITINGSGAVTQIAFSDVAESANYIEGERISINGSVIAAARGGGSTGTGLVQGFLTFKNLVNNAKDKTVGANALSSMGFLIPDDLSEIQKDNALTIINELRSKRAFPTSPASSTAETGPNTPFSGIAEDYAQE